MQNAYRKKRTHKCGLETTKDRHRQEYNIKKDLREMECDGTKWIQVAQNRDKFRAVFEKKK